MDTSGRPEEYGQILTVVCWTLVTISAVFVFLRLYCKFKSRSGLWWDDYVAIASWVCNHKHALPYSGLRQLLLVLTNLLFSFFFLACSTWFHARTSTSDPSWIWKTHISGTAARYVYGIPKVICGGNIMHTLDFVEQIVFRHHVVTVYNWPDENVDLVYNYYGKHRVYLGGPV
jgi:hypothetical protein